MIRSPRARALAAVAIVVGAMLICAAGDAFAGHLRGVTISWRSTANPGEVEFRFQYAGRWSALGTPPVGTSHSETVNFGDGLTGVATGPITSINPAEDWFVADLRVVHAYAGPGPYTAFYSNYSRMSGVRNAAPMMRLETLVRPMSGNSSSTSGSPPPVISISVGSQAGFVVPAFDVDADSLRFRLSTAAESGISSQPAGLSIDPATGRVTWNTGTLDAGALYAVQFTVEDLDASGEMRSKIPIDLTLRIARSSGSLPTIAIDPPGPRSVQAGTPITFTVTGVDLDPGDKAVTLTDGGTKNLPEERIRQIITGDDSLARIVERLMAEAKAGEYKDDITVAALQVPADADRAMAVEAKKGGIDLTADKTPLEVKMDSRLRGNDREGIKFNLDHAMLEQLQNAPGFVPVIINIQPMTDLRVFLGLQENQDERQASVL